MALSDWTDKANGGAFSLVSSPKYAGAKSLKIDCSLFSTSKKVLTQSETDSPKECRFKTQLYLQLPGAGNQEYSVVILNRYEDTSNYYVFKLFCDYNVGSQRIVVTFGKRLTGSLTMYNVAVVNGADKFNDWFEWEFRLCEVGGSVHGECYREGTYLGEHATTVHFAGGGAIGLGHEDKLTWSKDAFFDDTRIYY